MILAKYWLSLESVQKFRSEFRITNNVGCGFANFSKLEKEARRVPESSKFKEYKVDE